MKFLYKCIQNNNERKYIEIQNTFLKMKLLFVMEILGIFENIVIENVL